MRGAQERVLKQLLLVGSEKRCYLASQLLAVVHAAHQPRLKHASLRPGTLAHLHGDAGARVAVQAALDDVQQGGVLEGRERDAVPRVDDGVHLLDEGQVAAPGGQRGGGQQRLGDTSRQSFFPRLHSVASNACQHWPVVPGPAPHLKGVWPYTIWYRMHPRLQMSEARPTWSARVGGWVSRGVGSEQM